MASDARTRTRSAAACSPREGAVHVSALHPASTSTTSPESCTATPTVLVNARAART